VGLDHGAAALAGMRAADGIPLIAGRRVTGRSDAEERHVRHLGGPGPSAEQRLRAAGGRYTAGPLWRANAIRDGAVLTAQNPASTALALGLLLAPRQRRLEAA
jgi:hypothetical protein